MFDMTSRTEYEANLFAAELLIDDNEHLDLLNDNEKSFFGVAKELYIPAELLDFKFRMLKNKGYHLKAPYIAQADFLKGNIPGGFLIEIPQNSKSNSAVFIFLAHITISSH